MTQRHKNHAIRSLTRFFSGKNIRKGEYFIKQMTWAPVPDQRRSYHDIESMRLGKDWFAEDQRFSVTWLRLYVMFKTLSYGWGDEDVYVGDATKGNRHCRYCSCTDDGKFSKDAHAISEALGNKHVFSNEVWYPQASSEFWKGNTWVNWVMKPDEYRILPSSDPVFGEDDIKVEKPEEMTFPDVKELGLKVGGVSDVEFNVLTQREVAMEEMNKCSVNLLVNKLVISKDWMSAVLYFQILVSDTNNQERFYEVHFSCRIEAVQPLSRNIAVEEVVSDGKDGEEPERGYNVTMDYHLMQAIDSLAMNAAEDEFAPLRRGSCFEHCTMTKLLDFDCIRLMERRDVALLGIK